MPQQRSLTSFFGGPKLPMAQTPIVTPTMAVTTSDKVRLAETAKGSNTAGEAVSPPPPHKPALATESALNQQASDSSSTAAPKQAAAKKTAARGDIRSKGVPDELPANTSAKQELAVIPPSQAKPAGKKRGRKALSDSDSDVAGAAPAAEGQMLGKAGEPVAKAASRLRKTRRVIQEDSGDEDVFGGDSSEVEAMDVAPPQVETPSAGAASKATKEPPPKGNSSPKRKPKPAPKAKPAAKPKPTPKADTTPKAAPLLAVPAAPLLDSDKGGATDEEARSEDEGGSKLGDDDVEVEVEADGSDLSEGEGMEVDEEGKPLRTVTSALMGKKIKAKAKTKAGLVVVKKASLEEIMAAAIWKKGQPVPYQALAEVFEKAQDTTKRLEQQEILRVFFTQVMALTPEDLACCIYLTCNEVAPAYEGVELGIGDALLIKAIVQATGRAAQQVKDSYNQTGDLGIVAQMSRGSQGKLMFGAKPKELTARTVLEGYRAIANMTGTKSQDRKVAMIQKLLVPCRADEAKYVIRGLQGKLRIRVQMQTVLVSLAHALVHNPVVQPGGEAASQGLEAPAEEDGALSETARTLRDATSLQPKVEAAAALMKQAFSECPSIDELVRAVTTQPLYRVNQTCHLRTGIPVHPMLAKPTKSIREVLTRLSGQLFTCEFKYDGERAQIHLQPDGQLRIFSRNTVENTSKYPDLVPAIKECTAEGVNSFVIDAEVVAFDRETESLLPFQVLSTRKRKDEKEDEIKVQVVMQAFDMISLNEQSLLQKSLQERRQLLHQSFKEVNGRFHFAVSMDHQENGDTEPIEAFLADAVKANCEGLMVKTLVEDATYEPSKRSLNWLKLKKDYLETGGVADSLDLVPIGAFFGKGRRTGVYGAYLLACYEPETEEFQTVCKIGTGFSDELLKELWTEMKDATMEKKPNYYVVHENLTPSVWFKPAKVWEVRAADLSKSPVHKCAIGRLDPQRGISIRFPRLVRQREDKGPEQATTAEQIVDMYNSQGIVGTAAGAATPADQEDDWEL